MRPILCTKIHILCATTCAHSFCNKHRLFVFSFLMYFIRFACVCVYFVHSLRHSHQRCCLWFYFVFLFTFRFHIYFFRLSLKFHYICFSVALSCSWYLSFFKSICFDLLMPFIPGIWISNHLKNAFIAASIKCEWVAHQVSSVFILSVKSESQQPLNNHRISWPFNLL